MKPEIRAFKIEGLAPLLMHNPRPRRGNGGANPRTPEEWAETHAYRDPNGLLCLPSVMFRASLLDASDREAPSDPSFSRSVFPADEHVVLRDPEDGGALRRYRVHKSRVRDAGRSVPRSRPKVPRWSCVLRLKIDTGRVDPERVEGLLNVAGTESGVGDYRPQKGGTYGRYVAVLLPENAVPAEERKVRHPAAAHRRSSAPASKNERHKSAKG